MKKSAALPILSCLVVATSALAAEPSYIELLTSFGQQRTNAVRITKNPVRMSDRGASLCYAPDPIVLRRLPDGTLLRDPHNKKYAHVFVSPQGAAAMRTNSAVFPVNTIILKEKFSDPDGKKTDLFTGMLKRESGYNPDCGDWEFFVLSANAKKVTALGKLESCMACHVDYRNSDFVTKSY